MQFVSNCIGTVSETDVILQCQCLSPAPTVWSVWDWVSFLKMCSCTSGRFSPQAHFGPGKNFWSMKTFSGNATTQSVQPLSSSLLPLPVPLTEHSHQCWPVSQGTGMFVIMAAVPLSFALALLTWPSTAHLSMCVFVREGRWQRVYGPPGSSNKWLMAPWCSRCNSSFFPIV